MGPALNCGQVAPCGFHFVVGMFWMLLGSDGLLQVTLDPLPIGFVSWSFRGGEGLFFIFLIHVFFTFWRWGLELRALSMLGKRCTVGHTAFLLQVD